jgi:plastocyanin
LRFPNPPAGDAKQIELEVPEAFSFMRFRALLILGASAVLAAFASAQDITGTILIKKKLTRPSVTAAVSVYQRGTAVKLGKDIDEDPIAYERTRVVVYLEGAVTPLENSAAPAAQVQQLDRRFMPDLIVVPVGSTVSFPNMDPIFHNIYSLSKPKSFDLGSYDRGETRKVVFPKAGIVDVYCHLHPNMAATIVVTPNRWYARPDRTGQYRIPNVPPGQYTVVAWHKSAGFFRKSITVENGRGAVADFFIPLEADSKPELQTNSNVSTTGGSR